MKKVHFMISVFFISSICIFSAHYSYEQTIETYSSSQQNQSVYTTQSSLLSGILHIASVPVNYQISGGLILNSTLDKKFKSIILEVDGGKNSTSSTSTNGTRYLELWIPHMLSDTLQQENFLVSVNGQLVQTSQAPQNIEPRWIVINYQSGINKIIITGNKTIYDFTNSSNQLRNEIEVFVPSNTQNTEQTTTSSNNNSFSVELVSTIIFVIVIIVAMISLTRHFINKKTKLSLEIVRSSFSTYDDGITITVELKIHNKARIRTTVHEFACKFKADGKEIEVQDDNKTRIHVDFHSTASPEPIKFSLSKNKLNADWNSINEITLIAKHTFGKEILEHVYINEDNK
jgi:hypothetical protein